MAGNYTEHYGLNQWSEADPFVREEFNEDNRKTEEGILCAEVLAEAGLTGLEQAGYHTVQLFLQSDYEGKRTAARGLYFDGFRDASRIKARSDCLLLTHGMLTLDANRIGAVSTGFDGLGSSGEALKKRTAEGGGRLERVTYKIKNDLGFDKKLPVHLSIKLNGVEVVKEEGETELLAMGESRVQTFVLENPLELQTGDTFELSMSTGGQYMKLYKSLDGRELGATLNFVPGGGRAGRLTAELALHAPARRVRAWVRRRGGTVALSLGRGGTERPMVLAGERMTVNPRGEDCRETEFHWDEPLEAGTYELNLDVALGEETLCGVCDYGVLVL